MPLHAVPGPGPAGFLGPELHAAILQRRGQLKPVCADPPQGPGSSTAGAGGRGGAGGGGDGIPGAGAEAGLEAVLMRGLERFHFEDDTGGNTEFVQAILAKHRGGGPANSGGRP